VALEQGLQATVRGTAYVLHLSGDEFIATEPYTTGGGTPVLLVPRPAGSAAGQCRRPPRSGPRTPRTGGEQQAVGARQDREGRRTGGETAVPSEAGTAEVVHGQGGGVLGQVVELRAPEPDQGGGHDQGGRDVAVPPIRRNSRLSSHPAASAVSALLTPKLPICTPKISNSVGYIAGCSPGGLNQSTQRRGWAGPGPVPAISGPDPPGAVRSPVYRARVRR